MRLFELYLKSRSRLSNIYGHDEAILPNWLKDSCRADKIDISFLLVQSRLLLGFDDRGEHSSALVRFHVTIGLTLK